MKFKEQIDYWFVLAEEDILVADSLFTTEHYVWCLFLCHLSIEKVLKGLFIQNVKEMPPKIHDLVKLAKSANLNVGEDRLFFLDEMNKFNIEARYPDYKSSINKICTKEFTIDKLNKTKELLNWLKFLKK